MDINNSESCVIKVNKKRKLEDINPIKINDAIKVNKKRKLESDINDMYIVKNVMIVGSRYYKDYKTFSTKIDETLIKIKESIIEDMKHNSKSEKNMDKNQINSNLPHINSNLPHIKFNLISGGCKGTDKMVEKYALEKGLEIKVYEAEWNRHGKYAGPKRNKVMVRESEYLIAFKMKDKENKGTIDAIKNFTYSKMSSLKNMSSILKKTKAFIFHV